MSNHPFSHGDDGYKFSQHIVADFSSNVWIGGPPPDLLLHLRGKLENIGSYPQLHAESLTEGYANFCKLHPSQVLTTNGTAEAIFLVAQYFANAHSTIVIPAFSEYEHACALFEHELGFVSINELTQMELCPPGLVWICQPNNPTGHCLSTERLESLILLNPQTVFVVDEAYAGLCDAHSSVDRLIGKVENLLILRSMTKYFSIPGLRLGYLVGSECLIEAISAFQPPWSVNTLALEAGHFLLRNNIEVDVASWLQSAIELRQSVENITAWKTQESSTAYFLVEANVSASFLKQWLIEKHGLLIRDASNFRGLGKNHFRICSQTQPKNHLLLKALEEFVSEHP